MSAASSAVSWCRSTRHDMACRTRTATWTLDWFPLANGSATIQSRATDDSGNMGAPSASVVLTAVGSSCPCASLWNHDTTAPGNVDSGDGSAVELGVKFTSDVPGFITGLRFYKEREQYRHACQQPRTSTGTLLKSATFTAESAAGWQQVRFAIESRSRRIPPTWPRTI